MKVNTLLTPGVCAICEMANEVEYYDTLFNMHTEPAVTRMEGRKYLCENCFKQAAEFFGYEDTDLMAHYAEQVKKAQEEVRYIRKWHNEALDRIDSSDRKIGDPLAKPTGRPRKTYDAV